MNATDVVGYTQDGAFYCADCFDGDTDGEEVGAVFADSEWDFYPTCDACLEQCTDVSLTVDGERWLKSQQEMYCSMRQTQQASLDRRLQDHAEAFAEVKRLRQALCVEVAP